MAFTRMAATLTETAEASDDGLYDQLWEAHSPRLQLDDHHWRQEETELRPDDHTRGCREPDEPYVIALQPLLHGQQH